MYIVIVPFTYYRNSEKEKIFIIQSNRECRNNGDAVHTKTTKAPAFIRIIAD